MMAEIVLAACVASALIVATMACRAAYHSGHLEGYESGRASGWHDAEAQAEASRRRTLKPLPIEKVDLAVGIDGDGRVHGVVTFNHGSLDLGPMSPAGRVRLGELIADSNRAVAVGPEATVTDAIAAWPRLSDGAEFVPSPVDPGGVMLVLTPQGLLNLRVDRAGRLSSTGFRLQLRLPEAVRGAHAS